MQDNVPKAPGVFVADKPFSKFPGMRWHPETGDYKVFDREEDVPEGWLDCHPASVAVTDKPAPAAPDTSLSLPRKEVVAALREGGIEFRSNIGTQALHDLLVDNLKAALTAAAIEFDPASTDAKALMGLFPKE